MTGTPERRPVEEADVKSEHTPKLCECGCGEPTRISEKTRTNRGWVKGEPLRFINGHNMRIDQPPRAKPGLPLNERYEIREMGHATPCWVWIKSVSNQGYALMHSPEKKRHVLAHRYFYEMFVSPIPEGLTIDHLCRVRHCVNPSHLEPVTCGENIRRGYAARSGKSSADRRE